MNAASDFVQAKRILRIETPLGADVLLAQKLTIREGMSELFEGRVSVRSKRPDLKPADLLGRPVDVSVELGGGERRSWNAIVTNMIAGPRQSRGLRHYELVLRPQLWLLGQTSDWRIWLDKSALDVAEELLGEHGIAAPQTGGVIDPVPAEHYSVQAGESDLDYLTRRLEAEGLFYWFAHEPGAHRMHLASHPAGYRQAIAGDGDVRFAAGSTDRNHIGRFETDFRYVPGSHAGRDWNFETPSGVPEGGVPSLVSLPGNGDYERFEYPAQAGYGTGARASEGIGNAEVERVSRLRMQAMEAEHARIDGASTVRTLAAGHRFTPYDVANPDNVFAPHVILSITHEVVDTSYESVENQPDYANRFVAIPADVPATPRRRTPRPRIDGAQVAIVAGPAGEEVHPDEHGRVKLWFPWDRRARQDGSDTCWVRVAQSWAGAGWGGQVIPRIGMEVMVTYLDGDPDRPVVTGVVPNAQQKVPYELPAHKTRSVLRTNTHKGDGFNELRFEDERGQEEIFVHAQRDMTTKVENHLTARVDHNHITSIGGMELVETGGSTNRNVGQNYTVSVGTGQNGVTVRGSSTADWEGIRTSAYYIEDMSSLSGGGGNYTLTATGAVNIATDKSLTESVGTAASLSIGGTRTVTVGKNAFHSVSQSATEIVGRKKVIDAHEEIIFRAGLSQIRLQANGTVTISGASLVIDEESNIKMTAPRIDLN